MSDPYAWPEPQHVRDLRAQVARVEALAVGLEQGCRECPCTRGHVGYEGRDGIEPGAYCGARHRDNYARLLDLRAALDGDQ